MTPLTESAEWAEAKMRATAIWLDDGGDGVDDAAEKMLQAALPALSRWFVRRHSEALRAEAEHWHDAADFLDTLKEEG